MLLRSLLFNVANYLNFLVQAVLFAPVLLLPERYVWPIARFWVRSTLWLHRSICGIDDEIRGLEKIPSGGFIVASKHMSAWETLRLIELFPRPCFILKRQLLWVPLFGWYLWRVGMIPVDRGKGSEAIEAMTGRARRAIREARQIIIFPEGTRRPPLAPPAYRRGAHAALPRPRRALPSGRAEFRPVLAPPRAHASQGNDRGRLPRPDGAGAGSGRLRRGDPGANRISLRRPDRRGLRTRPQPARKGDLQRRTSGESPTFCGR